MGAGRWTFPDVKQTLDYLGEVYFLMRHPGSHGAVGSKPEDRSDASS